MTETYPFIANIEDLVPKPTTSEVPAPYGTKAHLSAMQMVQWLNGVAPSFPQHPFCFSIPGHSMWEAYDFVKKMQETVRWTRQNGYGNYKAIAAAAASSSQKAGRPPEYHFKIFYTCPCGGHHEAPLNSRKEASDRKCGCKARFEISHHLATNTMRVKWHWKHSHKLNTLKDMQATRLPVSVHQWVVDRFNLGIGWKGIQKLLLAPDLNTLCKTIYAAPKGRRIMYDLVHNLICTQLIDPNVFTSLALWQSHLNGLGWYTFAPALVDSKMFLFALQSPWQREMMLAHGTTMLFVDAIHNAVSNRFL
ncbi:hypothetical protein PTTG_27505 [Puccinia triticina 1-1 BBBD Race 1]|uniref:Uncharacterized protein n=1 Tax=Puccinia triticina (isolate 1-1 / race 1 (BBBD)) TaxID=630390 RepID=A0A180GKH7_PUCT1|nr:hypothetical protein PTTG_27505 [Puccinia triticina 1-1 BBBD Race 1]